MGAFQCHREECSHIMERSDKCSLLFWPLCFLPSWCLAQLLERFEPPPVSSSLLEPEPHSQAGSNGLENKVLQASITADLPPASEPLQAQTQPPMCPTGLPGTDTHGASPPSGSGATPIKHWVLFTTPWPPFSHNHIAFNSVKMKFSLRHTLHLSAGEGKGEWIMNSRHAIAPVHLKAEVFLQLFIPSESITQPYPAMTTLYILLYFINLYVVLLWMLTIEVLYIWLRFSVLGLWFKALVTVFLKSLKRAPRRVLKTNILAWLYSIFGISFH